MDKKHGYKDRIYHFTYSLYRATVAAVSHGVGT